MPDSLASLDPVQGLGQFHQTQVHAACFAAPVAGSDESFYEFCTKLRDVSCGIMEKQAGRDSMRFSAALHDLDKASTAIELYQFWQLSKLRQLSTPDGNN